MSKDVVLAEQPQTIIKTDDLANVQRLGNLLAASGYFTDAAEMAQAAVKVLAGQELGIPPIAAMMGINIIKGKVALGAHLIASRVKAHGYDFRFKRQDNTGCVLEFLSKVEDGKRHILGESSFTEADAKAALCFGDMYRKYPRNMYYSRAVSNGARWFCPEIFGGAPVFTAEELGAPIDSEGNAIIEVVAEPKPRPARQPDVVSAPANYRGEALPESRFDDAPKAPPKVFDFKTMLAGFAAIKLELGNKLYYNVLKANDLEHANEIRGAKVGREVYRQMAEQLSTLRRQNEMADAPEHGDAKDDWVDLGTEAHDEV